MKIRKIKPESYKAMDAKLSRAPNYPHFNIDLKYLPESKKWKIKGKYRFVLDVNMTGLHIDKGVSGEDGRANFDVTGIGVLPRTAKRFKRYGKE